MKKVKGANHEVNSPKISHWMAMGQAQISCQIMLSKTCYEIKKKNTIYVQIFEVHNFRGWTIFRIFAILFSRIAFHSEKFAVLFLRIACPQSLNAAEVACLCIVTLNTSQQQHSKCNIV